MHLMPPLNAPGGQVTYSLVSGALNPTPAQILNNKNVLYFGRIKTTLTSGKNVGYIRLRAFPNVDPSALATTGFFDPTNGTSPKSNREATSRVLSAMMKYLVTDLGCQGQAIIIDIRGNGGGSGTLAQALAEFFGATRPGLISNTPYKDDGIALLDQLQDTTKYSTDNEVFATTQNRNSTIFASYNVTAYPGSVFQGGKVIILTDCISNSTGDVLPNFFVGANLDKNIGAGTTVKFIGDIDGRFSGGTSGIANPMPVSQNSSFLTDAAGNPVSPTRASYDASFGLSPKNVGGTNYFITQQTPVTAIDAAPLKGTAGGNPLPNDWPQTVWPDLGFITPYPYPQLPGEPTPVAGTTAAAQATWNDVWLRQAILAAIAP